MKTYNDTHNISAQTATKISKPNRLTFIILNGRTRFCEFLCNQVKFANHQYIMNNAQGPSFGKQLLEHEITKRQTKTVPAVMAWKDKQRRQSKNTNK